MAETWLKCSACKNPIPYNATHWVCSVSTCNRKATGYVFCTVSCWDSHVADARHRDAWAVEKRAPTKEQWERELAENPPPPAPAPRPAPAPSAPVVRRVVGEASSPTPAPAPSSSGGSTLQLAEAERDILIVVSKMKKYIKDRSGFNCSDAVADMLSDHVRAICDDAIRAAARDERKTVLDRDVPRPIRR
ncbi:MAG: hypothetical protein HOV81_12430 [Kofleriaceae bacterium]|nr:hypothetical protein [Kofleriaceae bacterium]